LKKYTLITVLLIVFFSVGLAGHLFELTRPLMLLLTPFILLAGAILQLVLVRKEDYTKLLIAWLVATYLITFTLEVLGVKYGLVFGHYVYGDVLGLKVLGVPVIIGMNWVIIIWGIVSGLEKLPIPVFLQVPLTALLALFFDWVMEPVAIGLGYWTWDGGDIPLQNYIAWFVIAFVFALAYRLGKLKVNHPVLPRYVIIQFLFFTGLRIGLLFTTQPW
jgi:putative membrane protein